MILAMRLKPNKSFESDSEIGIIDCLLLKDGKTYLIEDKTTAEFDPNMEMFLPMNEQLMGYVHIAAKNGIFIDLILFRETLKSSHKLNKNENYIEFRQRLLTLYSNDRDRYRQFVLDPRIFNLDSFDDYMINTNHEISNFVLRYQASQVDDIPKNCQSCLGKYGACEYLEICSKKDCDIPSIYKPNGKMPLDGNDFRIQFGIYGESEIDESTLSHIDLLEHNLINESYENPKLLAAFINSFNIDLKEDQNLEKIISLFSQLSYYERMKFITTRIPKNDKHS